MKTETKSRRPKKARCKRTASKKVAKAKAKKKAVKKAPMKRGKSKVTLPDKSGHETSGIEAFRTNDFISEYLGELPRGTKSKFINDALIKAISEVEEVTCPTCNGTGKMIQKSKK